MILYDDSQILVLFLKIAFFHPSGNCVLTERALQISCYLRIRKLTTLVSPLLLFSIFFQAPEQPARFV